jgi:hypothetical protein
MNEKGLRAWIALHEDGYHFSTNQTCRPLDHAIVDLEGMKIIYHWKKKRIADSVTEDEKSEIRKELHDLIARQIQETSQRCKEKR